MRERFILPIIMKDQDAHHGRNHDTYYKNTNEINSLYELLGGSGEEKYPGIQCYDGVLKVDGTIIHFYLRGFVLKTTAFKKYRNDLCTSCMGHFEINSFEMHKGHFSENGYDLRFLNKFDTIFSGHFHEV